MLIDIFTNISEVPMNIKIRVAQYKKTIFFDYFCAVNIIVDSIIVFIMLIPIQLNNQFCLWTKEVNDI